MKKLFWILYFFPLTLWAQSQTTVTGTVQAPNGVTATSGYVEFRIRPQSSSLAYRITGTSVLAPTTGRCQINSSGNVVGPTGSGPCSVWGNTMIQPANTCYDVVMAPNGSVTATIQSQLISGTSYDLSAPVFCTNVNMVPQYQTITVPPININVIPGADRAFTLGSSLRYYAAAYIDNLNVNTLSNVENITASNINGVTFCSGRTGTTSAKIVSAIADLPTTGGIVNCSGERGGTLDVNFWNGVTKPVLVILGAGEFVQTADLTPHDGQVLVGQGPINRWRSSITCPTVIAPTSVTSASIVVSPLMGVGADSLGLVDICLDGTNLSGAKDGVLLDANTSGAYIEGFFLDSVGIYNFPQHQLHGKGTVFDITVNNTTMHNEGRSADNLVQYEYLGTAGTAPASKWMFYNPWLVQYTSGKWGLFAGVTGSLTSNVISNVVIMGGSVVGGENTAGNSSGANGVWVNGGLYISGTDFNASEVNQPRTIAIRYTGFNGGVVAPSQCGFWGTCLELGNSGQEVGGTARTGDSSVGLTVQGSIGFNNNCVAPITCSDIHIVGGAGNRKGTVINVNGAFTAAGNYGTVSGLPFVFNEATVPNDVLQLPVWTASSGGLPKIGPLYFDTANSRIGLNKVPVVAADLITGNDDCLRLSNTANSSRISWNICNSTSIGGSLSGFDTNESNRTLLQGNGVIGLSTTGAVAVNSSLMLDLTSTTKAFGPPGMTTAQRDAIATPASRAMIYNSDQGFLNNYNGAWRIIPSTTSTPLGGTISVRKGDDSGPCNLVFENGVLTSTTC